MEEIMFLVGCENDTIYQLSKVQSQNCHAAESARIGYL